MKRKRKHKKGKVKGTSASSAKVEVENNDSGLDDKSGSAMEIDTPSSANTDQPHNVSKRDVNPLGRVTVKLKKPNDMDSQVANSSDAPTQSDTDKSSQQMGLERQCLAADKTEDSANSLADSKPSPPMTTTKKPGTIKIKTSKSLGSNTSNEAFLPPKKDDSQLHMEQKTTPSVPRRYDKQELDTALVVIQKIMKMDAAEPFNVPVNPVALGIPDYFDVIDTPMDFGTICNNLENGAKYANSEDVYKDVKYIWDNCFKYNNKGDYILDLMKRVKKNFSKYWTTAGLYSEQLTNGVESSQEKTAPGQIKVYVKGGLSKKSSKKGHGRRHKSDCLCAICVLKRRRREREESVRIARGQIGESSPAVGSPSVGNSTSDMDESTADHNNAEETEQRKDVKAEEFKQSSQPSEENEDEENDGHEKLKRNGEEDENDDEDEDEEEENDVEMEDKDNSEAANTQSLQQLAHKLAANGTQSDTQTQPPKHNKESPKKAPKIRADQIKVRENPVLLELCGSLFPGNTKNSIWSGPHSLVQHRSTSCTTTSSIQAAIDTLVKHTN